MGLMAVWQGQGFLLSGLCQGIVDGSRRIDPSQKNCRFRIADCGLDELEIRNPQSEIERIVGWIAVYRSINVLLIDNES